MNNKIMNDEVLIIYKVWGFLFYYMLPASPCLKSPSYFIYNFALFKAFLTFEDLSAAGNYKQFNHRLYTYSGEQNTGINVIDAATVKCFSWKITHIYNAFKNLIDVCKRKIEFVIKWQTEKWKKKKKYAVKNYKF